ncbi:MAG: DUF423 domain-containing protein [Gammaproteobacteria bacterium]|nr:DUF423 domain-containing protein [Gammaproteobacteria bacterium]
MDRTSGGNARLFLLAGTVLGGLGVALGAFGAHGLKKMLDAQLFEVYETAVLYQFLHAFALLSAGLWLRLGGAASLLRLAGTAWLAGVVLFCGTLYLYVASGVHWLAFITPIGGVLFILGWLAAGWAAWKQPFAS